MPKFKIPVSWSVFGTMNVEADTLDEAVEQANDLPLPDKFDYMEDSFQVDYEMAMEMNDAEVS